MSNTIKESELDALAPDKTIAKFRAIATLNEQVADSVLVERVHADNRNQSYKI